MTGQKTLVELIKIRKAASDEMDAFFLNNRPLNRNGHLKYFQLTRRYLAALNEEMRERTCLSPTVTFLDKADEPVQGRC